ncbi:type II secretion system F family protein [Rhodovibrionaceae bacterium A322]
MMESSFTDRLLAFPAELLAWAQRDPSSAFLAVLLIALLVYGLRLSQRGELDSQLERRLDEVRALRHDESAEGGDGKERLNLSTIFEDLLVVLQDFASRLPLIGQEDRRKLQVQLVHAGFRSENALNRLLMMKLFSAIAFGLLTYLYIQVRHLLLDQDTLVVFAVVIGAVGGSLLPEAYVRHRAKTRRATIARFVPDALDLLVLCAEAGLTLEKSLRRVSEELRHISPLLSRELEITESELRVLSDRRQPLDNLIARTGAEDLKTLAVTLIQGEKYGTSLARSMRTIANSSRQERMLTIEAQAARLPALMSLPLMVLILPPVITLIVGPSVMQLFDAL